MGSQPNGRFRLLTLTCKRLVSLYNDSLSATPVGGHISNEALALKGEGLLFLGA